MLNNRWAILALLIVVRVVMGFQFQAVASVTPFMASDLGLDFAQIGSLVGF
ncbi:MAG: MFS transporter, partial [Rhodospirillaceae bacterium]|nr:MFS transporter [Rhodospirillaceae bacterium]